MSETAMLLSPGSMPDPLEPRLLKLKRMVLSTVLSPHSIVMERKLSKASSCLLRAVR